MDDEAEEPSVSTVQAPPCGCCGAISRYRCPACGVRTCSLACVNKHKAERPCTGKRETAAYKPVQAFDDAALAHDYHFLEGMLRAVDSGKRRRGDLEPPPAARTNKSGLAPARQLLLREASERGIQLELMPHGMQRQRENTSRYDARRKQVFWRTELCFASAGVKHAHANAPEACTVGQLLSALLVPDDEKVEGMEEEETRTMTGGKGGSGSSTPPTSAQSWLRVRDDGQRALLSHKLRAYAKAYSSSRWNGGDDADEDDGLAVFMRCEGPSRRADAPRYFRLGVEAVLGEALKGKVVVEYPTLHVALGREEADAFALVAEDRE